MEELLPGSPRVALLDAYVAVVIESSCRSFKVLDAGPANVIDFNSVGSDPRRTCQCGGSMARAPL